MTIHLTAAGAEHWDLLADAQFHALVAVDLDARVLTAPAVEPTRTSFTSLDGQLQLSGFTRSGADAVAAAISRSH